VTKKCLIIAVAVLAAVVMTIPSIMFVQAKKDVIDISYSVTGVLSTISSGEVEINWTPDWRTRIARGTWRLYSYNGPLGAGTMYTEAIISITHYDNESFGYTTYHGHGNYRTVFTITEGPYGAGTLEGVSVQEWDFNVARTPRNLLWGNGTFHSGSDDLKGVRMVYTFINGVYTGEIISPPH
jgi:hypothetical protein